MNHTTHPDLLSHLDEVRDMLDPRPRVPPPPAAQRRPVPPPSATGVPLPPSATSPSPPPLSADLARITIPFGKYKGRRLYEVATTDLRYLLWLESWLEDMQVFKRGLNAFIDERRDFHRKRLEALHRHPVDEVLDQLNSL